MLDIRIAKLRFLLEEIRLGLQLATHAGDGFAARTLARHVLIRAYDVLEHARRLRRPLNEAGHDTREFNDAKEAYGKLFEEFFKVSRDKLAAHVQDLDFGKRLGLWNAIQLPGLSVFADEALNIYNGLAPFALPGYVPFVEPPEKGSQPLLDALGIVARAVAAREGVHLGADSLALARPDTVAVLGKGPLHERAGQLALIGRWIDFQADLLGRIEAFPAVVRILKARLVTDVVSFCDCLVTRPVSADAPQAMDGLDTLLATAQESPAPISEMLANTRFTERLHESRAVRNHVGGHLDDDEARPLTALVAELDGCDASRLLAFFALARDTFQAVCRRVPMLSLYGADRERVAGALATARSGASTFEGPPPQERPLPLVPTLNDEAAYHRHLSLWLHGDAAQRHQAKEFFKLAFDASEVLETLTEEVIISHGGTRFDRSAYRKGHAFLAHVLAGDVTDDDFPPILQLMVASRAHPYPLSEVLLAAGGPAPVRQALICRTLGDLGSEPHAAVDAFLRELRVAPQWLVRAEATAALYKRFVRRELTDRANRRARRDHGALVADLASGAAEAERLLYLLAFASVLNAQNHDLVSVHLQTEQAALAAEIDALARLTLVSPAHQAALRDLRATHHYAGVALHLMDAAGAADVYPVKEALLYACTRGLISCSADDCHLLTCHLRSNHLGAALPLAEAMARANPGHAQFQLRVAEVLTAMPNGAARARATIAHIRYLYPASPDLEAALTELDRRLARPDQQSTPLS